MSLLAEFLSELIYWLTTDENYRSGFLMGTVVCLGLASLWRVLFVIHFYWKKFRKIFEPTKNPGKMPVELGPSPASMVLGCLGGVFIFILVTAGLIFVMWRSFPES